MSRRLTIVRHAKSDWGDFSMSDFERPLNARGERDAPDMGRRLAERGDAPDLVITSPALRALTTARVMVEALPYDSESLRLEESIYEAPVSTLLELVQACDDGVRHLMLVGHNPGCEQLVAFLTGEPAPRFVTCGVADLEVKTELWKDVSAATAKLQSYWYPKLFKD